MGHQPAPRSAHSAARPTASSALETPGRRHPLTLPAGYLDYYGIRPRSQAGVAAVAKAEGPAPGHTPVEEPAQQEDQKAKDREDEGLDKKDKDKKAKKGQQGQTDQNATTGTATDPAGQSGAADTEAAVPRGDGGGGGGGGGGDPASPALPTGSGGPPPAPATFKTETIAPSPGSRDRKTIAVGEEVRLTVKGDWLANTPKGADPWHTTAGTLSATGAVLTTVLTANDVPGTITVTAGTATATFTVVAPTNVHQDVQEGPWHRQGRPSIGMRTVVFIGGDDTVNFYNVKWHELEIGAVATGCFAPLNGVGHGPNPNPIACTNVVVAGKGNQTGATDKCTSGDPGGAMPGGGWAPGSMTHSIPWEYQVGGGGFHSIRTVPMVCTLAGDQQTLSVSKAGASVSTTVNAASSGDANIYGGP